MNKNRRPITIAALVLILSSGNLSRLTGSECIRPIHMITLMTMGAALAIIVQQLLKRYQDKQ